MKTRIPPERAVTGGETHWVDQVANVLPEEWQLPWYRDLSSWLRSLPPDDEFGRIAYAMGFLTLLIREAPVALASEREQFNGIVGEAGHSMKALITAVTEHREHLESALKRLPIEVADGLDPEKMATSVAESFRQQFAQLGLKTTAQTLASVVTELNRFGAELEQTLTPLRDRYAGSAAIIEQEVGRLNLSAIQLRESLQVLVSEASNTQWAWRTALCFILLLSGFLGGVLWNGNRSLDQIEQMEVELTTLNQTVAGLAASKALPPAPKRPRK